MTRWMLIVNLILKKNDLDVTFKLRNSLHARLDDILEQARKKVTSLEFPGQAFDEIPNGPLSTEKNDIKTEDFFIDNSLRKMFNPEEAIFFSHNHLLMIEKISKLMFVETI